MTSARADGAPLLEALPDRITSDGLRADGATSQVMAVDPIDGDPQGGETPLIDEPHLVNRCARSHCDLLPPRGQFMSTKRKGSVSSLADYLPGQ